MARSARGRAVLVRRAQPLVAPWRDRTLRVHNYATGIKAEVPSTVCELLSLCDDWTTLTDLASAGLVPPSAFSATIRKLVQFTLLERSDRRPDPRVTALDTLRAWNPQAGFFHLTTKDVRFAALALKSDPAAGKAQDQFWRDFCGPLDFRLLQQYLSKGDLSPPGTDIHVTSRFASRSRYSPSRLLTKAAAFFVAGKIRR